LQIHGLLVFVFTARGCIVKLLFLWRAWVLLLGIHFFGELSLDNGKSEIQKEKGTNEDDWIEVNEDPGAY